MKRTYFRLLFRGVKKSITRFLSILAIVALGVGFLAGLSATAPDMEQTVDEYYDKNNVYDINIKGTLGLTGEDADTLRELRGVELAVPAYSADVLLEDTSGQSSVARIIGVDIDELKQSPQINGAVKTRGEWPSSKDECIAVLPSGFYSEDKLGEVYTLSEENEDAGELAENFTFDTLKISGIADSPIYMSIESEPSPVGDGSVDIVLYADESVFDLEAYTDIFIRLDGAADMNCFSAEYTGYVAERTQDIESLGKLRSEIRLSQVKEDAQSELNEAKAEYEDKKREADEKLADAAGSIEEGEKELKSAENEIAKGESRLKSAKAELAQAEIELEKELESARFQIADGRAQADAAEAQLKTVLEGLNGLKAALDANRDTIEALRTLPEPRPEEAQSQIDEFDVQEAQYAAGMAAYEQKMSEVAASRASLDAAEQQLAAAEQEKRQQLELGKTQTASAESRLRHAKRDYAEGERELVDAKEEYSDALKETDEKLADAEAEIADAQERIDSLELPEWYITDRTDNVSYDSYKSNVEKIAAIAKVFPVFFFVVAALVALTTMTRMVDEERTQTGTLKALGYSDGAVLFYYLGYSGLASVLGSIGGAALGFDLLPRVIANAYSMMYNAPAVITPFRWEYMLIIAPIAIIVTMAATLMACCGELAEKPAALLLPRAPKAGKRIFLERIGFIWKRMSFTGKVTARNLFRYKKRLFMTVIGIAGCTALLVTGFGLRDSISDIVDKQFFEINKYNMTVYVKDGGAVREDSIIFGYIKDGSTIPFSLAVCEKKAFASASAGSGERSVTITVPEKTELLKEAYTLRNRRSGSDIPFDEESVVLTEKLAEQLGISVGDTFELRLEDGGTAEFTVSGVTENYVYSRVYMSSHAYERAYGSAAEYTTLLMRLEDDSRQNRSEITTGLLKSENVNYVSCSEDISESFDNAISKINYIVWVLIIAAGALAVIVLYNLTNINVCERTRELATLKVLGFYSSEMCMYIFRETGILAVLGTALGLLGGIWLHSFVIRTAEVEVVMFGRDIYALSFLLAAALTMVFTALVDIMMIKRIKNVDMVQSLKANE